MSEAHFIDTSALLKRYVDEPGSEALEKRCFSVSSTEVFVSALSYAEAHATSARLTRDGHLTIAERDRILKSFERDWGSFVIVELGAAVRRHVPGLAKTHSLTGADLAQLASAMSLYHRHALDLFVVCDVRLANAAALAGLPVFNPETPTSPA